MIILKVDSDHPYKPQSWEKQNDGIMIGKFWEREFPRRRDGNDLAIYISE